MSTSKDRDIHILFVDDEVDIHDLYRLSFREEVKSGCVSVSCATSVDQALKLIDETVGSDSLLVAITDLNMPGRDGFELIKLVRSQISDSMLYVVSAYDRKDYVDRARSLGVMRFFAKPLEVRELKKTLSDDLKEVGIHNRL